MNKRHENTVWLILMMAIFVAAVSVLTYNPISALAVLDMAELEALDSPAITVVADEVETVKEDNSGEYDGDVIITTAREVITMTIVDGVKTFTNHLIG